MCNIFFSKNHRRQIHLPSNQKLLDPQIVMQIYVHAMLLTEIGSKKKTFNLKRD